MATLETRLKVLEVKAQKTQRLDLSSLTDEELNLLGKLHEYYEEYGADGLFEILTEEERAMAEILLPKAEKLGAGLDTTP